jgi:hypothetical protein
VPKIQPPIIELKKVQIPEQIENYLENRKRKLQLELATTTTRHKKHKSKKSKNKEAEELNDETKTSSLGSDLISLSNSVSKKIKRE